MKKKKMMSVLSISAMLLMVTSASAFAAEVPASVLIPAKEMTSAMKMVPATEAIKQIKVDTNDTDISSKNVNADGKEMFKNLIVTMKTLVPSTEGISVVATDGIELFKEIVQGVPQK